MPNISVDGVQDWNLTLYIDKTTQCGRSDFTLPIRRGEALVHILHATIKDKDQNGLVTFNDGTTAVLCIPANPTQSIELDCTIADSVVSCILPAAVSQIASSTNLAYFKFVNETNHTIATTESFTIKILRGAGEVDELIDVNDFSPYFELNQATIAATKVPDAPTTNGTYILKATMANGTPTYFWEVQA
ncbi:MAG: hypothetical protein IKE43_09510 [Coriobacteriales bacterium]|nr:hypothetical protein [Coriobacteriales bacterium]